MLIKGRNPNSYYSAKHSLSLCCLGVNNVNCHYTMASADSKFDDLSDVHIDSLIDDTIPKNTEKATAWGISMF